MSTQVWKSGSHANLRKLHLPLAHSFPHCNFNLIVCNVNGTGRRHGQPAKHNWPTARCSGGQKYGASWNKSTGCGHTIVFRHCSHNQVPARHCHSHIVVRSDNLYAQICLEVDDRCVSEYLETNQVKQYMPILPMHQNADITKHLSEF